MTIAIAQIEIRAAQPRHNTDKMLKYIARAKQQGAELILFPELAIPGLLIGDSWQSAAFLEECADCAAQIAAASAGVTVVFGNAACRGHAVVNSLYLAADGELGRLEAPLGAPFVADGYKYFSAGGEAQSYNLLIDGKLYRVGFLLGDWRGRKLPYLAEDVDLLVNASMRPLTVDKDEPQPYVEGRQFISLNGCALQATGKSNYIFCGGSYFLGVDGAEIARAPQLQEGMFLWRRDGGELAPRLEPLILLAQALEYGLRSFCRDIQTAKAVIGISGGIDSALAACLYTRALGADNLLLISMPSRFNSERTQKLAQRMAEGLGCGFACIPIEDGLAQFTATAAAHPQHWPQRGETAWSFSAAAYENMQARERARILSAAAAALGGIFTCNGNKTELSVGYATFYGDLAGALAAQADLWKRQVYALCGYYQRLFPNAPLAEIAAIRPSAELSPEQDVDKGLGDPLIYDYHDYLLASWVEKGRGPLETLRDYADGVLAENIGCDARLLKDSFAGAAAFIADLEYWWKQYRGLAVAKRQQAPPLLAVSSRPFGEARHEVQGTLFWPAQYQRLKQQLLADAHE
ncbi:MAG: NAD(+) synthase [Bacillota bacterium]|nr:NAD(+) synthase [Bacillota bacterium]